MAMMLDKKKRLVYTLLEQDKCYGLTFHRGVEILCIGFSDTIPNLYLDCYAL